MLPSILARQLQKGLGDYVETTFPMTNEPFRGSIRRMLATKGALFHEPYLAVRLPFRVAEEMPTCFEAIHMGFLPYVHQERAFGRLTGDDGRSTLIATGTGSGKTECFLYPILEYCYRHRGERGIKALIIYPMNALATDQARRIARLIYESPELRGNVTAGMYVGGHERAASRVMGEDFVITDRDAMLASPPDILLTNYKMLDYLLVRPRDAMLWQDNDAYTLKYVAVDEFHTFDGAQGTDLACLLRRLKKRLGTDSGYLCCVGTSATMGDQESEGQILSYASEVFGERFEEGSVVTEDRLSAREFLEGAEAVDFTVPTREGAEELSRLVAQGDEAAYLRAAVAGWFEDFAGDVCSEEGRLALSGRLMGHGFLHELLLLGGGRFVQAGELAEELSARYPQLAASGDAEGLIYSFYALISHARTGSAGHLRPFLFVQVQLWLRELRRLLARVSDKEISYALARDLNANQARQYLPVVNCRDCGATGWVGRMNERRNMTMRSLDAFYNMYFRADDSIAMMFPYKKGGQTWGMEPVKVCPDCLQIHDKKDGRTECPECGGELIEVLIPSHLETSGSAEHRQYVCPCCGSRRGLSLMGLRGATEISAGISQVFASRFNDDKKTLAFSDSVQDAAHRAGFFNARTWRFALRTAIQAYVRSGGAGQSLKDFSRGFLDYWHGRLTPEAFVGLFIAPNMTWMRAYEEMKAQRKLKDDQEGRELMARIEKRLSYEIMLEYGLAARIGRTLAKSGCSALALDMEGVGRVAVRVRERAVNELGVLREASEAEFLRMVLGFLDLMRMGGAFDDRVFYRMLEEGNSYLISSEHTYWMPGRQSGRNTPRFLANPAPAKGRREYDTLKGRRYTRYLEACSPCSLWGDDTAHELGELILSEAVREGLVRRMPSQAGALVYGLDKSRVHVTDRVRQMRCDSCGNLYAVPEESAEVFAGAPCLSGSCMGHLAPCEARGLDYYAQLYGEGDLERINAREHTGLLQREDRERLERDFKRGKGERAPWDPNVLSCTPTLEMGIDIGDLSTVILCSIPPGQAQFLQRAGRAGRKDGNALTLAVANARPHDLYFYAEPLDMIAGSVLSPKIFLKASAVLERQLVAYCMDSWVKSGIDDSAIQKNVGYVLRDLGTTQPDLQKFPFNFLDYVKRHINVLLNSFLAMFSMDLDQETQKELRHFAKGQANEIDAPEQLMHERVLRSFQGLKEQHDALLGSIKELVEMIRELKAKPKDSSYADDLKELTAEKVALSNVCREIRAKDVFNFLSDEGVLPNYAFPEAGIVLRAVLIRKAEKEEQVGRRGYEKLVYEYSRAASAGISEFAPLNTFYVDGRRLTVNQVDLTMAQPVKWRLCPSCSYAQIEESGSHTAACPRCGSPAWADSGQVREMLKVQMVYSNADYKDSLIGDESDDRSHVFYTKQLLVDVNEDEDIESAYEMPNDDFPFGYEFVKKATLREINFGESDMAGEKLMVSGVEAVRKGFKICKHCGTIQTGDRKGRNHAAYCKVRKNPSLASDAYEECLFLYREFHTEVLRLLIPATTMDTTTVRTESFVAAFMLGMKEYFGNVDHLRATVSEVPVPETDHRKQYLVVYDSVPGGTGYLRQLMTQKDALTKVFEKALYVMEHCSCKDDAQKDGCYHCLYAYRQSQNIGSISRRTAMRLLKSILSGKENVKKIDRLSHVSVNPLLESELERRFVEALGNLGSEALKAEVTKSLVNGKEGYVLKVNGSTWEIEPQVTLGSQEGVAVMSKPDFVLWPVRSEGRRPVAVFTDGFQYHKDKVADDTLKRTAIMRSEAFRVWSLSWHDVQGAFVPQGDYATATLEASAMPSGKTMYQRIVNARHAGALKPSEMGALELLLRYLAEGEAERLFAGQAEAYAYSLCAGHSQLKDAASFDEWNGRMKQLIESTHFTDDDFVFGKTGFGRWSPRTENVHLTLYSAVRTRDDWAVCAVLNDRPEQRTDKYEQEWNGFWHFANVMQFAPAFMPVSEVGLEQGVYMSLPITGASEEAQPEEGADAWQEAYELIWDEGAKAFAHKLSGLGVPCPAEEEIGFELTDARGGVVGMAELVWRTSKVAYLTADQAEWRESFLAQGWRLIDEGTELSEVDFGGREA